MGTGTFIVLEGVDGCGKSTQAERLAARVAALGREVVHTREPGGTRMGERVRDVLLDKALGQIDAGAEVFLYQAARAQLVAEVIRPALDRGAVIVCERWHYATMAYQTAGYQLVADQTAADRKAASPSGGVGLDTAGAPAEMVRETSAWATRGTEPDRALLLDLPVSDTAPRLDRELDRIESRGDAYRAAVARVYLDVFSDSDERFCVVDAVGARDDVEARVWEAVLDLFQD